jgi:hypothetical protein
VTARWLRNDVDSSVLWSWGSSNRISAAIEATANGTVRKYVRRGVVNPASTPPASELATRVALSMNRTRPIRRWKASLSPFSSSTAS